MKLFQSGLISQFIDKEDEVLIQELPNHVDISVALKFSSNQGRVCKTTLSKIIQINKR